MILMVMTLLVVASISVFSVKLSVTSQSAPGRHLQRIFLVATILFRGQRIAAGLAGLHDVGPLEDSAGCRVGAIAAQLDVDEGRCLLPQAGIKDIRENIDCVAGLPLPGEVKRRALERAVALEQADIGAFGGVSGPYPLSKGHIQSTRAQGSCRGGYAAHRAASYRVQGAD
jgi:hypothetical protein